MSEATARVLAPPPVIFLGAIGLGLLLYRWRPFPLAPDSPAVRVTGGALVLAGLALSAAVVLHFGRAGTPVSPLRTTTRLVLTGPYRRSRNPDYLGQTLVTAGLALLLSNAWILAALVPALLLVRYGVIAREERYLERRFGEDYRRYCQRVRRWI